MDQIVTEGKAENRCEPPQNHKYTEAKSYTCMDKLIKNYTLFFVNRNWF